MGSMAVLYVLCVDLHVVDVCGTFFSWKCGMCSCMWRIYHVCTLCVVWVCVWRICLRNMLYVWCVCKYVWHASDENMACMSVIGMSAYVWYT